MTEIENNPPFYRDVLEKLEIDPEEQTKISHEDRFVSVVNAHPSKILSSNAC